MRRVARACAVVVALVAIVALIGWFTGRRSLASIRADFIPMAPNTALSFIVMGTALLLLSRGRTRDVLLALCASALVALVVLMRLSEYATRVDLGVDRWLFQFPAQRLGLAPVGRMALVTALSFLLTSVAAFCMAMHDRWPLLGAAGRVMLVVVAFVGLLFALGYAYGNPLMYEGRMIPMALNTAASFFLLASGFGLLALAGDVAERRRLRKAIAGSEERHRAVVEQAADGITLVDAETLAIIDVNRAFERLVGFGREELIGRPIADFIVDTQAGVTARAQQTLGSAEPTVVQRQYRRKDGSVVDVEKSATVLELAGRRVMCTVIHDITERQRAQKLLEEKNRLLEQAVASEREAHRKLRDAQSALVQAEKLAGLGQMVAGVAHEINNPLSFVSNNVAVLERDARALAAMIQLYARADPLIAQSDPALKEEIAELCERVDLAYTLENLKDLTARSRDGLKRIQQIVRDLRDFARLDQGDQNDVDLNAGIESTVNIILGRAKKKRVRIATELGPLPTITCQAAKVNQVVMNLLANAIDACDEGGTVTVRSAAADGEVRVAVSDTGPGIDPAVRDRIFDPFFTTKPVGEGTGLGLSISYGIVQDHGGRIDIESPPGQGATFTVVLPIRKSAAAAAPR